MAGVSCTLAPVAPARLEESACISPADGLPLARFMNLRLGRPTRWSGGGARGPWVALSGLVGLSALTVLCPRVSGAEFKAAAHFRKDIQPILTEHCYECHG